jgi:hypothetical protein
MSNIDAKNPSSEFSCNTLIRVSQPHSELQMTAPKSALLVRLAGTRHCPLRITVNANAR